MIFIHGPMPEKVKEIGPYSIQNRTALLVDGEGKFNSFRIDLRDISSETTIAGAHRGGYPPAWVLPERKAFWFLCSRTGMLLRAIHTILSDGNEFVTYLENASGPGRTIQLSNDRLPVDWNRIKQKVNKL